MQVTNAVQTIEDQASWFTSLFEEKEAHPEEMLVTEGFSYLDQDMYFGNQDFEFLSANDTCSS